MMDSSTTNVQDLYLKTTVIDDNEILNNDQTTMIINGQLNHFKSSSSSCDQQQHDNLSEKQFNNKTWNGASKNSSTNEQTPTTLLMNPVGPLDHPLALNNNPMATNTNIVLEANNNAHSNNPDSTKTNAPSQSSSNAAITNDNYLFKKDNNQQNDLDNLIQNETTKSISVINNNNDIKKQYERFTQWIYCIAVVNFDIEIGQSIECVFPKNAYLTEKEISSICYLSFPDSNSGCMGDTQFYFRTKTCPIVERDEFDKYYKDFNTKCLSLLEVEKSYFYGFVYFRQVKDRNARRGYFQKSLVILTWFPFITLFNRIMKTLAPQYFEFGLPSLEAACSDINRWPSPITDQILNLPLFGNVLQVWIPGEKHSSSMCQITSPSYSSISANNNNNTLNINNKKSSSPYSSPSHQYNHHHHNNHHLSLKSLSLLKLTKKSKLINYELSGNDNNCHGGEEWSSPSTNSDDTSTTTTTTNSSTATSHNQVNHTINNNNNTVNVANDINIYKSLLPVIAHVQLLWELVLTNEPIAVITQTPNVCSDIVTSFVNLIAPLRYGADYRPFFTIHDSEFKEYTSHSKSPPPVILGVTNPFFVKTLQDWPHLVKINEFPSKNGHKKALNIDAVLKVNSNKSLDIKTGVYTKYKPFLQKDREILKKLLKGIETNRPAEAQNVILRRFLIELTQSFSIPLERYFASLMPLAKNLSPFKRPPILHHFKVEDFIKSLDATGPHLTSVVKGDWTGLYRRFLRSPNFVCWYSSRLKEANNKIMSLHLETVGDSNLANLLNDKPEIVIVDLILKLKENLKCASNGELQVSPGTVQKIQYNMDMIIDKLPEDSRLLFERKSAANNDQAANKITSTTTTNQHNTNSQFEDKNNILTTT